MNNRAGNVEDGATRLPVIWTCCGVILALFVGGLILASRSSFLHHKPQSNLPNKSSALPKDNDPIVHERRLPSGTVCRVALRATVSATGRAERIEALEVSINGQPAHFPAEAFSDLRDVLVQDGVQMAEFAGDTFLLLAGGEGATTWRTKFTFRELNLTEREFTREGSKPLLARYPPPLKVEYFSLPPEAIAKARKLQESKTQ